MLERNVKSTQKYMQSNAGTIPLLNIVYLIYNINPGQVLLEWGRNTDQHAFPLVDLPAVLLEVLKVVFKGQASLHGFSTKPQKTVCST